MRRPIIGAWSSNVAVLLAHKVADNGGAWASCTYCKSWKPVDLAGLVIKKGPLLSLWNRRPACPGCQRPMSFHATHSPGHRVIPLVTDDPHQTDDLHRLWQQYERRRRVG